MNKEERKQYALTPQIEADISVFWAQYKKDNNVDDGLILVLVDGRMNIRQFIERTQGRYIQ